jgi:hypothetical protein
MATDKIKTNRAPVMVLWAALVAERLGYDHETALTLGQAVSGLNAVSKGRRLGIYSPPDEGALAERVAAERAAAERGEQFFVPLLGREVPAKRTEQGIRALKDQDPIDPRSVSRYLAKKFGDALPDAEAALRELAQSYSQDELEGVAYQLYEQFRPAIPEGKKGWGAQGELDLDAIRGMARR